MSINYNKLAALETLKYIRILNKNDGWSSSLLNLGVNQIMFIIGVVLFIFFLSFLRIFIQNFEGQFDRAV